MKGKLSKSFATGSWLLFLLVIVSAWHYFKVFEETLPWFIAIPLGLLVDLLLYLIVKYGMRHMTTGGVIWSLIMTAISYIIYYTFYTIHQATLPLKSIFGIDSRVIYSAIFPLIIMACSWYFPRREAELKAGETGDPDNEPEIKSLEDVFKLEQKPKKNDAKANVNNDANNTQITPQNGTQKRDKNDVITDADYAHLVGAENDADQAADKRQLSAQENNNSGRRPGRRKKSKSVRRPGRRIPVEINWETCIKKDGERYVGICPACAKIVRKDYSTERSAMSGVSGHLKTCEKLAQYAAEKEAQR